MVLVVGGVACSQTVVTGDAAPAVGDAAVRDAAMNTADCTACYTFESLACVDLATDPFHCGACQRSCTEWDDCRRGVCVERVPRDTGVGDRPIVDAVVDDVQHP
ncbi:MAG: Stigma-specific protein Stig1 [Myxococcaceae bacterium]|nr:Stigma-specific protein Stig1 [Myxococcaceae bacterium]